MDELERIRRRIEAGQALTEAELRTLEDAAERSADPSLRLAVAHALSNVGDDAAALARVERLCVEQPHHLGALLGKARALVGLERYAEAEGALSQALALNPGDPEALKASALLAIRRGEFQRAEALAADALRRDPFDGEARLIREELSAADLPPVPPRPVALRAEFIRALRLRLAGAGVACEENGADLVFRRPGGESSRVSIISLYSGYLAEGAPLDTAVEGMARQLDAPVAMPDSASALLERARPVLRPADFSAKAAGAAWVPGPAGLATFFVLDDPELVRYVPAVTLERCNVSLDALCAAAWANLERTPAEPRPAEVDASGPRLVQTPTWLWAVCAGDGYDAARLLCASERALLVKRAGAPPYFAALGQRDFVLLGRADDATRARLTAVRPSPDGIPGLFVVSEDGRLTRHPAPGAGES